MFNKKAQELSIGTLILIVLGIIVLVLLVMGFAMGWDKLWDRINIFGGDVTIDDKVLGCNLLDQARTAAYCSTFESIDYNGKKIWMNCQYGPVESRLQTDVTCPKEESENVKAQCLKLLEEKKLKADTTVNNVVCMTTYLDSTCEVYGGKIEAKAAGESDSTACEDVKDSSNNPLTKAIRTGIKISGRDLATTEICCVAP